MNTVTRVDPAIRGCRLVPGGLDVPALDPNQSPLPSPFHLAQSLICSSSTAHKGGDPRRKLIQLALTLPLCTLSYVYVCLSLLYAV